MSGEAAAAASVTARYDRGARVAILVIAAMWHLAINLPGVLTGWSAYRWPVPVALGWVGFAVVGTVGAVRLLRDTDGPVWPLVGTLLVIDVVVFAATPPALVFLRSNWGWASIGWFAIIVLWHRPTRDLIAVLVVNAATALVAVLASGSAGRVDLSRYAMYVYGTVALQLAFVAAVRALRSAAAQAIEAASAEAAVEAERHAAEQAHRDRRARYREVRRAVGGVLADLAAGRADAAVRRRCAVEAARLRRLIAESDDVPDPLLHELRACADVAERAGVAVEMVCVGQLPRLPVEVRRLLAEPLARPLSTARGPARVTVAGSPDEVAVSVVTTDGEAATGQATGRSDVTYTCEREEGLLWVETRWRAR
jgi:hypothetical protein